jgi:uncharacterized protein (TIGR02246 family)
MKLVMVCAAAVALHACGEAQAPADSSQDLQQLMQTSREWSKAAEAGDMNAVAGFFTDDAVMISSGEQPVRGRQAIQKYLAEASQTPGFKIRWEPIEGRVSGDMGYLLERTQITMTGPQGAPVTQTLQAVTVWRKTPDGSWRNVVDASLPAAGSKAPR